MKRLLPYMLLAAMSAMAADWSGYIIDKNCASKKAMWGNEECAQSCLKRGTPAVLVTEEGKIYSISNQDKVKAHAGHKVTVTGKMDGDTITVEDVKM